VDGFGYAARVTWKVPWVIVLVACGRIGFEHTGSGPDDDDPGMISLRVTTDDAVDPAVSQAGFPVRGATVLIDRGNGGYDRIATDALGSAQFAAASVRAFHVVYHDPYLWRVYTVAVPHVREIEIGGRAFQTNTMTVSLPAGVANDSYQLQTIRGCGFFSSGTTPMVEVRYRRGCEGKTVHALSYAFQPDNSRYLDAGDLTLSNGTSQTVTGSYLPLGMQTIQLENLPSATAFASVEIFARSAGDLVPLSHAPASATLQGLGGRATVAVAPGGDTMMVRVSTSLLPGPSITGASSSYITAASAGASTSFDASILLPMFESITLDSPHPFSMMWSGGDSRGTLTAIEVNDTVSTLLWRAYLEPSATSATFPALPPDLGVPSAPVTFAGSVIKYDIPGATAADVVRTLDRGGLPAYDTPLVWSEGVGTTTISSSFGVR
jgi:hypothetical protein